MGDRFAVPGVARIVEQVLTSVDEWPRYADEAGVPRDVTETVQVDLTIWATPLR